MWGANKNSRLGIEIIGGKDILPLECFGIQGCLERERDRERQYGNLSFLWTWNACWVGKCVEWPLRELGWACIICQPKNIRHLLPKKNIRHLDEVLFSVWEATCWRFVIFAHVSASEKRPILWSNDSFRIIIQSDWIWL